MHGSNEGSVVFRMTCATSRLPGGLCATRLSQPGDSGTLSDFPGAIWLDRSQRLTLTARRDSLALPRRGCVLEYVGGRANRPAFRALRSSNKGFVKRRRCAAPRGRRQSVRAPCRQYSPEYSTVRIPTYAVVQQAALVATSNRPVITNGAMSSAPSPPMAPFAANASVSFMRCRDPL